MSRKKTTQLKHLITDPQTVLMPFGSLPMHAQMAERAGFPAFEVSGAQSAWWSWGIADIGYLTMTEVVQHAGTIARSVDIPVYCDADTAFGFGSPISIQRTVHEFIRAGVAGIHIEDQKDPKKAGGQPGIELASDEESVLRLRAAVAAKDELDPDFVIVARTDGFSAAGGTLEEAIRRGQLYMRETGVDAIFYEGLQSWADAERAIKETPGPAYAIVSRSAGPAPSVAELTRMGQAINIVLFTVPGVQEVWNLLLKVRETGELAPIYDYFAETAAFRGTVQDVGIGDVFTRPNYDDARRLEELYLPPDQRRDYSNTTD